MNTMEPIIEITEIPPYYKGLLSELGNRIREINKSNLQYSAPNTGITIHEFDGGLKISKELYPAIYLMIYIDVDAHSVRIEGQKVESVDGGWQDRRVSNFTEMFDLREGIEHVAEYILRPILES